MKFTVSIGLLLLLIYNLPAARTYDDSECSAKNGNCQMESVACQNGNYESGLCGGPASRKCCVPYDDSECSAKNGNCQMESVACQNGNYESGLCGGPASRKCCVPYDDSECSAKNGNCQMETVACENGNYESGLCGGPASRKCCVPDDDGKCTDLGGDCQTDSALCEGGGYVSSLCSGPSSWRCCVPSGSVVVPIVSREEWDASPPAETESMTVPVGLVFIHHTAGSSCDDQAACITTVKGIQNYHMTDRDYSDIAYNFLVGGDGKIYEGRGWSRVGAHTLGYNDRSIAISFMGDFTSSTPTSAAQTAAKNLINKGVSDNKIASDYTLSGHRDVGITSCPGQALYNIIKQWPNFSATPPQK